MAQRNEVSSGVLYFSEHPESAVFGEAVQAALGAIEARIGACENVVDMLGMLWEQTAVALPRDRISIAFLEENGEQVVARHTVADYERLLLHEGYSAGLGQSSLRRIIETGDARIIEDLQIYLQHNPDSVSTKLLLKEGVRSNVTLPLRVGERRVGFLFFSSRTPAAFNAEHIRILLAVLERISQAVEKAWLIQRLQSANEGYVSMLGFVSHELKSPLASLIARGTTYTEGYLGPVDPKAEETVRKMMKAASYLLGMVTDYLGLARLEGGEMKFEPQGTVPLVEDVVQFVLDSVAVHAAQRGSRIVTDFPEKEILVRGDAALLRIVFNNLLDNAVKYGDENIDVKFSLRVEGDTLVATVRNKGVGFTEEQKQKLFRKFSRLQQKGTEDRRGSGLGLYLTFWVVQKHEGRITADSVPGEWAEFTVKLPGARFFE